MDRMFPFLMAMKAKRWWMKSKVEFQYGGKEVMRSWAMSLTFGGRVLGGGKGSG